MTENKKDMAPADGKKPLKKSALAVVDKAKFLASLKLRLAEIEVQLTEKQLAQLTDYYEILVETNRVMNLTGIVEADEVAEKHIADSLRLLKYMNGKKPVKSIIDVGTGAGLPGVPLAVACPDCEIILLDSQRKRCDFLEKVCQKLGLENAEVVWGRAEEAAHNEEYRERQDMAVARAVAPMPVLLEYLSPLTKMGGTIVAMKGSNVAEEVESAKTAARELNTVQAEIAEYQLTSGEMRSLAIWQKQNAVKKKYPRNSGAIKKKPL